MEVSPYWRTTGICPKSLIISHMHVRYFFCLCLNLKWQITRIIRLYASEKIFYDVQRKLKSESLILFGWFHDNYLKAKVVNLM